jgi:hypothetical protein
MSQAAKRRFSGLVLGFTISANDLTTGAPPLSEDDVNRLIFQESTQVLREGGRLVFGHRWKIGGVMHYLASKARDLRRWRRRWSDEEPETSEPAIINVLAWNDLPPAADGKSDAERAANELIAEGVLRIEFKQAAGIELDVAEVNSDLGKYCRMRSLTEMRRRITELSDARICLGGGANKPERRLSGVLEEVILAIQMNKPLYLASALGGISKLIVDAILGRKISGADADQFFTPEPACQVMRKFRERYPYPIEEGPSVPCAAATGEWDALRFLQEYPLERLCDNARLDRDDLINLMTTAVYDRAMALASIGIDQIQRHVGSAT